MNIQNYYRRKIEEEKDWVEEGVIGIAIDLIVHDYRFYLFPFQVKRTKAILTILLKLKLKFW